MSMHLVIPALWGDSISTTKEFSYLQELFSFLSPEQPFPFFCLADPPFSTPLALLVSLLMSIVLWTQ